MPHSVSYSQPMLTMKNETLAPFDSGQKVDVSQADFPHLQWLDYAEIALLACLLLVGGPLNIMSFVRSLKVLSAGDKSSKSMHEPLVQSSGPTTTRSVGDLARKKRGSMAGIKAPTLSRLMTLKLHLTAANMLILFVYGLSQICWLSTYGFHGGDVLCKMVALAHVFCFYATSNLVACIAVDRLYVAIYVDRPRARDVAGMRTSRRTVSVLVYTAWILALLCSVPQLLIWRIYEPDPVRWPGWQQCTTVWQAARQDITLLANSAIAGATTTTGAVGQDLQQQQDKLMREEKIYNGLHLIVVFWLPALIVVVCYALIVLKFQLNIRKNSCRVPESGNSEKCAVQSAGNTASGSREQHKDSSSQRSRRRFSMSKMDRRSPGKLLGVSLVVETPQKFLYQPLFESYAVVTLTRAKKRTVKKSVWILLAYIICWSPYNILALWRYLDPNFECQFLEFMYNLIVLNAVVNPLIYGL